MYTLYHHPYSQHARRVVSLFESAGLEYKLESLAMEKGAHMSPEYLAINPNHQVPTLIDGALKLHESNAILRYVCSKHALNDWYPQDLATRAQVEQWLDWNQCRLAPTVTDIVFNKVFMGDKGDAAAIERGEKKLPALAAILDSGLKDQKFLAGEKPTIADLSVASNIFQLGLAQAIPSGAHIARWYAQVSALRGFQKSLPQG